METSYIQDRNLDYKLSGCKSFHCAVRQARRTLNCSERTLWAGELRMGLKNKATWRPVTLKTLIRKFQFHSRCFDTVWPWQQTGLAPLYCDLGRFVGIYSFAELRSDAASTRGARADEQPGLKPAGVCISTGLEWFPFGWAGRWHPCDQPCFKTAFFFCLVFFTKPTFFSF